MEKMDVLIAKDYTLILDGMAPVPFGEMVSSNLRVWRKECTNSGFRQCYLRTPSGFVWQLFWEPIRQYTPAGETDLIVYALMVLGECHPADQLEKIQQVLFCNSAKKNGVNHGLKLKNKATGPVLLLKA